MKKFIKNIENFTCFNCKLEVIGGGYTNHCTNCLWSLHVDINPGDRANPCRGEMRPIGLSKHKKGMQIIHECTKCKVTKKNIVQEDDNQEQVVKLVMLT